MVEAFAGEEQAGKQVLGTNIVGYIEVIEAFVSEGQAGTHGVGCIEFA